MSSNVFKEVALVAGSVAVSTGLYFGAFISWTKYRVLSKISRAKIIGVGCLRQLVLGPESFREMLVVVRGLTKANSKRGALVSRASGEKCVALEQSYGSIERKTLFTANPFILREGSNEVFVNLEGSSHQLPFEVHDLRHREDYLVQEKILPLEKKITVVGMCSVQDGNIEIKSCKDLPVFLTPLTERQVVNKLTSEKDRFLALSYMCASLSVSVFLVFVVPKISSFWRRWKNRREP